MNERSKVLIAAAVLVLIVSVLIVSISFTISSRQFLPGPWRTASGQRPPTVDSICPFPSSRPILKGSFSYSGQISIESPANCTTGLPAEFPIDTYGSFSAIPPGATLWVLVYPPNGLYYPQSPNSCSTPAAPPVTQAAGSWSVSTYLGMEGNLPQWFDIVVILADQEASAYLGAWLSQDCLDDPNKFTGIGPDVLKTMNITELGYITVRTR